MNGWRGKPGRASETVQRHCTQTCSPVLVASGCWTRGRCPRHPVWGLRVLALDALRTLAGADGIYRLGFLVPDRDVPASMDPTRFLAVSRRTTVRSWGRLFRASDDRARVAGDLVSSAYHCRVRAHGERFGLVRFW